ncbi:MAG: sugar isomerase [Chthonomonadaceae bacterium]|nr:sugar isomerase [Chthonomonadaceae bacterium]
MNFIDSYLTDVKSLIDALSKTQIEMLADHLHRVWEAGGKVLLMGNGGSSATASHIVNDLQKCIHCDTGKGLRTMCLSDCTPLILAWGNDTEFANIYAPQVECWAEPGDLIIAISGSGNSPNILNGVEAGKAKGAFVFGLAGFGGGKLAGTCDECLTIYSNNMQRVEDLHMIVLHLAFSLLRERVTAK